VVSNKKGRNPFYVYHISDLEVGMCEGRKEKSNKGLTKTKQFGKIEKKNKKGAPHFFL